MGLEIMWVLGVRMEVRRLGIFLSNILKQNLLDDNRSLGLRSRTGQTGSGCFIKNEMRGVSKIGE
jgi:hypothetical protein